VAMPNIWVKFSKYRILARVCQVARGGNAKFLVSYFWFFMEFEGCVYVRVCAWAIIKVLCALHKRFKEEQLMTK